MGPGFPGRGVRRRWVQASGCGLLAAVAVVSCGLPCAWAQPTTSPAAAPGAAAATTRPAGPAAGAAPATAPARTWLEEVVVTATRVETDAFVTPYSVSRVPMNDFEHQRLARTTPEALQDVLGVTVQKTSEGQASPYIRGFTGFRTLLLVDGIRLNNSVMRDGPNQYWGTVDNYSLDHLEVVRGPSSVLYGSDAIGGTVNAITRDPSCYGQGFQSIRTLMYRNSTAERSNSGRGEIEATYEDWLGALVGGTWERFGDVDGGKFVGPQDKTGYGQQAGDAKIKYKLNRNGWLTMAHYEFYQDDAWRAHKTIYGTSWHGTMVGDERSRKLDQGRSLTYAKLEQRNIGTFIDAITVVGSYQQTSETQWRTRANGRFEHQGFDVETYGLSLQLESPLPVGRLVYGAEVYQDEVRSFLKEWNANGSLRREAIQGPVADDADYNLVGAYMQYQLPLAKGLELTAGERFNRARAGANEVEDPVTHRQVSIHEDWDSWVGSVRMSWLPDPASEHLNIYGGVSQGFRAPNLSDLTRLDTARSSEIETPSPGVEPEKYVSYEVGVKSRYEKLTTEAAYFFTDVQDMIVRAPTGATIDGNREVTKKNAGNGYVQGVELGGKYRFLPQWTVFANGFWTYGEVDGYPTSAAVKRREPISRLMPPTARSGLRWDSPDKKFYVEGGMTAAAKADKLSAEDRLDTQRIPPGGTPGYLVFDLRGGWKVTKDLDVWVALENVGNLDYRIHGSGVNEPGINLISGVKWKF